MATTHAARAALRNLLKAPGYTSAVVATLALVVGANSAIFSAVYAVLLRPLPIAHPEQLVISWASDTARNLPLVELSYDNFEHWAAESQSFTQMAAMGSSTWPARLDRVGESERLAAGGVSVSFFETLGVAPQIGRAFQADDDLPNAPRVVVLSHRLWSRRFGADPAAIGTTVLLPEPHRIVGVMPDAFDFPRGTDFWTPIVPVLAMSSGTWRTDTLRDVGLLFVIGRLRAGVTPSMAAADLDRIAARLDRTKASERFGSAVVVTPFLAHVLGPVRPVLWALFGAVGVLLLIGCANVSGLMLTRVSLRRREQAVRLALGATRRSVALHWLLEAVILCTIGGALGLLASVWMTRAVVSMAPADVPRLADISINLPVAAFTFAIVAVAALLCGMAPTRRTRDANVTDALRDARATEGRQTHRARSVLVIVQVALSVMLLVAAGLVVRSFMNLRRTNLGFVPSQVVMLNVDPRDPRPTTNQWIDEFLRRVGALPDVEAAGAVYLRPWALGPIGQETLVLLEGQPDTAEARQQNPLLNYQVATPGYFPAMRIALKRGRLFSSDDRSGSARVALVSETTARRLWPAEDAIGKRLLLPTFEPGTGKTAWRTVVGVVNDVRYRGIDDVRLDVYDVASQAVTAATDVVVRTSGDPGRVAAAVRAEALRLDPLAVVDRIATLDATVSRALAPWRFGTWMFIVFAALAAVLVAVGLFSVVSLDVARRRHEFAIRLALGARPADILRTVLIVASGRAGAGVVLGVLASIAATRAMGSILFGIGPLDPGTYAAVVAVIVALVTAGSYVPARAAASIEPLPLLRRE
jgi:putative ABC transport system permease protein